jgi:hypothetical protein
LVAATASAAGGCRSTPEEVALARRDRLGTPPITHAVLVRLKDPARTAESMDIPAACRSTWDEAT